MLELYRGFAREERLLNQAANELEAQDGRKREPTINNVLVRNKAYQLLQRRLQEQRHDTATPLSETAREVF